MFLGLRKLGNICCGHKMFLNKLKSETFFVPDTKFVSATNVARAGKRENICVGNNVPSFARALSFIRRFLITVYERHNGNNNSSYVLLPNQDSVRNRERVYSIEAILLCFALFVCCFSLVYLSEILKCGHSNEAGLMSVTFRITVLNAVHWIVVSLSVWHQLCVAGC